MNTNTRLIGQWVMMDNGLVWQWTAVREAEKIIELRPNATAPLKAA
jgi:hypothetical protein